MTSPRSFWCASRNRITSDWDTTASMIIVSSMTDASYASLYTATRWQYVALRGIAATDGGPRGPGPGPGPSPGILSIVFPPSPSARLTAAHSPGFGFASEPRFASSSSSRAATHAASSASCPGATITLKNPARTRSSIGVSDLPWYTIRPSSFPERRSRKSPSAVSQNARPAVASSSAVMDAIHVLRLSSFRSWSVLSSSSLRVARASISVSSRATSAGSGGGGFVRSRKTTSPHKKSLTSWKPRNCDMGLGDGARLW